MPRRRNLPDELDPRVREFVEQLRKVVDRAGLGLGAVADRTGYGRTSWERYLDGRLLAPKGAVIALAEITGTPPARLTALWEPAARAWNGTEPPRDRTVDAGAGPAVGAAPPGRARAPQGEFGPPPSQEPRRGAAGGGRTALFLAGVLGVVTVVVGAFLLTGGGEQRRTAGASGTPSPSARAGAVLPSGVLCQGSGCTGKDAEAMGCGGGLATTARSAPVGRALVEVRYSRTCGAVWGRVTQAVPGDVVRVTVGSRRASGTVATSAETIAYTPMIAAGSADRATACAVLASGEGGCTG
ncbi:helix-turn-helix domain-containing protein [Streptomyces sp. NPDC001388]|uniref:helix-turn-helix domain-containing protein n=1 Tax=Streptomyces sp. NPDC001388 TaxID=3364568 RepID=UPI0036B11229